MALPVRKGYKGAPAQAVLTNSPTSGDTSFVVDTVTGWATTFPFYCVVEPGTSREEKVKVTAISTLTLTVVRAQDDTTASGHNAGAAIYPVFTADEADEANLIASVMTTKGDVIGTDGSSINRLGIGTNTHVLQADSTATNGFKWGQVATAGITDGAVTGAKLANGYTYVTTVYFTSTGTFSKASYSYLRAIKVKVQGAGGGGGGTGFGYFHGGGGGGGGGYAEAFITNIAGLASSVTVTVPTAPTSGSAGGSASFGTAVVATGGAGGGYAELDNVAGGSGGVGTAGDVLIAGSGGGTGFGGTGGVAISGAGGSSMLGGGGAGNVTYSSSGSSSEAGRNYGGGGGGAATGSATSSGGSSGSQGIVIVELYA